MKDKENNMIKAMPEWGPYSKKYFGISKVLSHSREEGVRFDFTVLPAVANSDCKAPNVTLPVGVHPWECKSDYSYWSYRQDLEWKDIVYSDVSFTRLSDGATLVRTEIFNNSPLMQNCLVNYFASVQYPFCEYSLPRLPEKCELWSALDYSEFSFNTPRPWDAQVMDAMKKGEFFDGSFYRHRGLGDRDNNRYILPKYPRLAEEKGDRIVYRIISENTYSEPVLCVHYRTTDNASTAFSVNGKTLSLEPTDALGFAYVCLDSFIKGENTLELVSLGGGGAELDFFAVCEKGDRNKVGCTLHKNNFVPEAEEAVASDGGLLRLSYEGLSESFYVKTFNPLTRFRKIETGCLEDVPSPRLSQPDPSFDNMLETFSGEFNYKHSDEGYFHNMLAHTLYISPGESHVEYAVLTDRPVEYLKPSEYEEIYLQRKASAESFRFNEAGKEYEFSNNLLRAAILQNTVYPLWHHGEYVVHHTPGKRWDSFYTWDSGFIGLDMNLISPRLSEYMLDLYLSERDNPDYAFLLHGSPVPVQIYQYYEMLSGSDDRERLYSYYDRAKLFYEFLAGRTHGSTTARFKSGLTTTFDYFYNCSGMDDLPSQAYAYRLNKQLATAPCISSSQVIRTAKLLSIIAEHLGKEEDIGEYRSDIERLTNALNKYAWDEESGYYGYVLHNADGNPEGILKNEDGENMNKTLDGVYPLIAGACESEKSKILLSHLKSENELFTPVGISAVDRSASYFSTNGYWNGNVWFSHQWFVWKAMLDTGEADFAYKIAETALKAWKKEVEYSYYTFEMISITTGRGGWFHNFGGLSSPINLWANAYFAKGSLNCGFDCFKESVRFNEDFTSVHAVISHYNDRDSTVIAVLDGRGSYRAELNGEPVSCFERAKGTVEITIPASVKRADIKIQLV